MKKILFLPLLRMSSGHHQVADSIVESLKELDSSLEFEKEELLSYSLGFIEKVITGMYLKSIKMCPSIYSWIYHRVSFNSTKEQRNYLLYEIIFTSFMQKILRETKPDLIVCTHALPSYILNRLKGEINCSIPVLNVYTDYFVNQLWGLSHIDYHFAPSNEVKKFLCSQGVAEENIFVTGIPVHPSYLKNNANDAIKGKSPLTILISGGSLGTGNIKKLVKRLKTSGQINYFALCGENKRLFNYIQSLNNPYITPFSYITSKKEMDRLYTQASGIITKPGGVTISETLRKRLPIFIYSVLPGQEEINLTHLKKEGLVYHLEDKHLELEAEILSFLTNAEWKLKHTNQVEKYLQSLEDSLVGDQFVSILKSI